MIQRKDKNYIKKLIREVMIEQLNKSAFKTSYKPNEEVQTNTDGGSK